MLRTSERKNGKKSKSQNILEFIQKIRDERSVKKQIMLNIGLYEFIENINDIKTDYIQFMTSKNFDINELEDRFTKILFHIRLIGYYSLCFYENVVKDGVKIKNKYLKFKKAYNHFNRCFYNYIHSKIQNICPNVILNDDVIKEICDFL